MSIEKIVEENYCLDDITNIEYINRGKIHDTYKITTSTRKYIFQKINSNILKNVNDVMHNMENVINYLKSRNINTLSIIYTKDNKPLLKINNDYYRMYENIIGSTYNKLDDLGIIYLIGKAYGNFNKNLIDYNNKLKITIKDFHNTPKIYNDFIDDIKNRNISEVINEVKFIKSKKSIVYKIYNLLDNLPIHLIHGDTKVSNVIINNDDYTVIDLDTLMYNTVLYDYGDMIRSACNAHFDMEKFKAITKGYLEEMKGYLTEEEIENMGISILTITIELGIRYLDDYINGNIYFKISYDKENLDRARNLFKLYNDIESRINLIDDYIKEIFYE